MRHIKKFEKYEFEDFTAVDMDLVKDLYEDGMTDPKEIHRELDFRNLSINQVEQIIYSLKKSGQINENYKINEDMYHKISIDEYNDMYDSDSDDDLDEDPDVFSGSKYMSFKDTEIQVVQSIVPQSIRNLFRKDLIFLKYIGVQISIHKFDDEWFLVMVTKSPNEEKLRSAAYSINDYTFEYYKCDQIDGLIYLLKKLVDGLMPWRP